MKFDAPRLFITFALFAAIAFASPMPAPSQTPPSTPPATCSGTISCCNSVGHANDGLIGVLLGLLGVVVKDLTVLIGVTCSPISSGQSCALSTVCCTNNSFNGVIALDCTQFNNPS
ncbi:fungal hydrophobin [Schizopora paradoxa]|uniref:Hydrophobin n=1 Tax=Schizopora paradoxa TaxID=27342 RepID=A0A0H2RLM6_9AGAM|nr:fungal hydrophobin [Schizopora paradoxa]